MPSAAVQREIDALNREKAALNGEQFTIPDTSRESPQSVLRRGVDLFGTGFNEGLSTILGLPVDMINAGLTAVGVPTTNTPFLGGKNIKNIMRSTGFAAFKDDIAPASGLVERITQGVGEEIGAAAVPLGGALRAAGRGGKALKGVAGPILKPFAETPLKATAIEGVTSAGAGVGGGVGDELAPGNQVVRTLGQLVGGVGSGLALDLPRKAFIGAKRAIEPMTQAGITNRAADRLQGSLAGTPEDALANIKRTTAQSQEAVGVSPTPAQASEDPGFIQLERGVSARDPGKLDTRLRSQRTAVKRAADDVIPEADHEVVSRVFQDKLNSIRITSEDAIANARGKVDEMIKQSGGGVNPDDANTIVRSGLLQAESEGIAKYKALFGQLDPAGGIRFKMAKLKKSAAAISRLAGKAERSENVPDVIENIRKFKGEEPMSEIMTLRSRITDDIRVAEGQQLPNKRLIARLEQLKNSVDDAIINDADLSGRASLAPKYEQARQEFRSFADKFRRGAASDVLRKGRGGASSASPESSTISRFFKGGKGSGEAAQEFNNILGSSQSAKDAVEAVAVRDFVNTAFDANRKFSAAAAARWVSKHRDALKEFPGISKTVREIGRGGEVADALKNTVEGSVTRFERSAAKHFLGDNPEKAIDQILSSPNPSVPLRGVVSEMSKDASGGAMRGLRSLVWKRVRRGVEGGFDEVAEMPFLSPNKFLESIVTNEKAFVSSGLYTAKEMSRLKNIARSAVRFSKSTVPPFGGGSDTVSKVSTIQKLTGALSLKSLLSRFYSIARGVVSVRFVASELGTRAVQAILSEMSADQVQALLRRAVDDPRVAETLLMNARKQPEEVAKRLRAHLLNLVPATVSSEGDE